ncbi:MAG TPA: zf-HC2 domain-containing protein [Thermoanaerobaculia bacterium]|nr:zf-HC2 domain-containing protein [Thermoanaerobaculia bacterium]
MENRKPPLEPALRALTRRAARRLDEHPSPETLAAYHEGELADAEAERLRYHLALCPECAALLLDLGAFADLAPPAGVHDLADGEVEAAWRAVQPRLDRGRETPSASNLVRLPPPASPASTRSPRPAYFAWALAASWLAVVGLGLWVIVLQREITRSTGASAKVAVAGLSPAGGDSTRGREEPRQPVLSASRGLVLQLVAAGLPDQDGYAVEIQETGTAGRVVWSGPAERDPVEKDFTVVLPPGFLRPGRYQVHLYGTEAGVRRRMADFPFQVGAR